MAAERPGAQWVDWWHGKRPGERRALLAFGALIIALLAWALLWLPLTRDLAAQRAASARTAAALAAGRATAVDLAALTRTAAPPPLDEAAARGVIERALGQHQLTPALAGFEWRDGRARLTLTAAPLPALASALETIERDARLFVVEASLTALAAPGQVRAELTLGR
jgi:type II secretory pathway component PulM